METTDLRTEFTKETKTRFNTEWLAYNDYVDWLEQRLVKLLTIPPVSGCFYLQSEKTPADSGEYEVITNRGRVIKIKYKIFEDNGIWECEYGKHEINESVVAWRFLK